MNTCESCKHWRNTDPEETHWGIENPVDEDTYEPKEMPWPVRACSHPAQTFCERPVERNGFGVADGSRYWAKLYTGPDFGCVRYDPEDR